MSGPGPISSARQKAYARLFARLRRFLPRDERGVAAVEFALLLPVMLTLYIGSVEVSQGLSIDRKVVLLARTLADLTTQNTAVTAVSDGTSQSLAVIAGAASAVLSPVNTTGLKLRISSLSIASPSGGGANTATVCWSYAQNWSTYTRGAVLDNTLVPTSLRADANTSIVMAEVQYPYKPVIGYVLTGTLNLGERVYMRPRLQTYVTRSDLSNQGLPSPNPGPCT
jgi:Flp pilus assembly protein TadG